MSAVSFLEPITAQLVESASCGFHDSLPAPGGLPFRLVDALTSGKSEATRRGYLSDLDSFAAFFAQPSAEAACRAFIMLGMGAANAALDSWKGHQLDMGLSSSTINRRLACVRSMVKVARRYGLTTLCVDVEGVRHEAVRDSRGPGVDCVAGMLRACEGRGDAKGKRDAALIRLAVGCGLRRAELLGLDVEHVDLERSTIAIKGKGKRARATYTLPAAARAALVQWLEARGMEPGPLFVRIGKGGRLDLESRLSGQGLADILKTLSPAGQRVRPHGLRHAAITMGLDTTGGDVRTVQRFSRHASLEMVCRYDDDRTDRFGAVAGLVDARLSAAMAAGG